MRKKLIRMRKVAADNNHAPSEKHLLATSSEEDPDEEPKPFDFRSSSIQTQLVSPFQGIVELTPNDSCSYFESNPPPFS